MDMGCLSFLPQDSVFSTWELPSLAAWHTADILWVCLTKATTLHEQAVHGPKARAHKLCIAVTRVCKGPKFKDSVLLIVKIFFYLGEICLN